MKSKVDKVLVLYNSVPYFLQYFEGEYLTGSTVLQKVSLPLIILRKITRLLGLPQSMWFGKWKSQIKSFNTVIIFAPLRELDVLNYIKKQNFEGSIICWYWNPVFRFGKLDDIIIKETDLWSFDPEDCKKYNMKFNTTFYFKKIVLPLNEILYDAIFIGIDKGRADFLRNLEDRFDRAGLNTYFHIVPDPKEKTKNSLKKIPYQQYLELVSKSKAIIDIIPEGQSGLTLRPMESIFLEKKLITTDSSILDQDFYNAANVFIIGIDDESLLRNFINTPFIPVAKSLLDKYDVQGWLARFKH